MIMARPVNADSEATRLRLLAAAAPLLSEQGDAGVSLRKVAGAAGVSLGTVQYHFGSKEGLVLACREQAFATLMGEIAPIAAMLDSLVARFRAASGEPVDLAAVMEELMRQGFRFSRTHQPLLRIIMRPLVERGELEPQWRDSALVPFFERAADALSEVLRRPRPEIRFAVQALTALGMRYALSSARELADLAGPDAVSRPEDAVAYTEEQLVALGRQLLRPRGGDR
jgi:AcrR family transcriptional regulator